jgi:lipoyl(octanoyl) transferase
MALEPVRRIRALWLGRRRYEPVHALQRRLAEARRDGRAGDTLLLLEHEPVITLGRGARAEHVLASREALRKRGIDVVQIDRGGDVTFHGPGQLVGYPILDLAPDRCDVRRFVGDLVETMILLAADHGVGAGRIDRHVGVWVDAASPARWPGEPAAVRPEKLGAVGVHISRWITTHGFAFNACADLEDFGLVVPCGIREHGVTSLERLRGHAPAPRELARAAAEHLCERLGATLEGFASLEGQAELEACGLERDERACGRLVADSPTAGSR